MLSKTHLSVTLFLVFLSLPFVPHKVIFFASALFATLLPDLDSKTSKFGREKIFRPLQLFLKHRGVLHSFVSLIFFSVLLKIYFPSVLFGFILGYSSHLLMDALTVRGIAPFYPFFKFKFSFIVRTGKNLEKIIYWMTFIFNGFFVVMYLLKYIN